MTAKELREYEEGRTYGRSHPSKTLGWTKSAAWNAGMAAGQKEYWKEWKKKQKSARELNRIDRAFREARGDKYLKSNWKGAGGAGKND